jgi:NitT/TauT family transport system substrate-binding protein
MKKNISVFILLAVIAAVIGGFIYFGKRSNSGLPTPEPNQAPSTEVSVRLPIPVADTGFAAFYLAVDNGFFKKHGLKVTLQPGSPELNPVKMVSQNTDQFGLLGGPELLLSARNKGAPIIGVALLGKNADFAGIVALKSSGLTKLDQLQGKKVGFFIGHISTDILHMLFKKENIKVEEIDTGFDYGQLISGKIDAEWAFRTTAGIILPAKGVEINFISPADYGIHTHGYTVVVNQEYAKQNPDIVKRFVAAIIAATKYSTEHPQEAVAATMKRDPNFKQAVGDAQVVLYNKAITNHDRLGAFSKNDLDATSDQMKAAGLLPTEFNPAAAFDEQFIEAYYLQTKQ